MSGGPSKKGIESVMQYSQVTQERKFCIFYVLEIFHLNTKMEELDFAKRIVADTEKIVNFIQKKDC